MEYDIYYSPLLNKHITYGQDYYSTKYIHKYYCYYWLGIAFVYFAHVTTPNFYLPSSTVLIQYLDTCVVMMCVSIPLHILIKKNSTMHN